MSRSFLGKSLLSKGTKNDTYQNELSSSPLSTTNPVPLKNKRSAPLKASKKPNCSTIRKIKATLPSPPATSSIQLTNKFHSSAAKLSPIPSIKSIKTSLQPETKQFWLKLPLAIKKASHMSCKTSSKASSANKTQNPHQNLTTTKSFAKK